jgi:hypothetical protein
VVVTAPSWSDVQRFRTLRAALNSIRPVLDSPDETPAMTPVRSLA